MTIINRLRVLAFLGLAIVWLLSIALYNVKTLDINTIINIIVIGIAIVLSHVFRHFLFKKQK